MAKIVKFPADFYDMGEVKFAEGKYYPLNSETQRLVDTGYADLIDSEDDTADHVGVLQALADIANERADAAMAQAKVLAAEAADAQALADAARTTPAKKVQSPAQIEAAALRQTANDLLEELRQATEAFTALDAQAKAAPDDVELQAQVSAAHQAGLDLSARCDAAVQAAAAAEAA